MCTALLHRLLRGVIEVRCRERCPHLREQGKAELVTMLICMRAMCHCTDTAQSEPIGEAILLC